MVLYPNLGGFGSGGFLRLGEPELMLECVTAYNDFLVDWASADLNRLLPVMALPFWDVEASVKEIQRSAAKGHRAVLFGSRPETFGEPPLAHKHWDPIWAATQEAGLPISFHIGAGDLSDLVNDRPRWGSKANFARGGSLALLDNQNCLASLIFGGVCAPLPRARLRLRGERCGLALVRARDVRLAVGERRRGQGASGVRPAPVRVLRAPDLRIVLVREARDRHRHPGLPRTT